MDALSRDVAACGRESAWDPWGKCGVNGPLRVALPDAVESALRQAAARQGIAMGTLARIMIEVGLFGRDEVERRYSGPVRSIAE